jgi:hypothetical protein
MALCVLLAYQEMFIRNEAEIEGSLRVSGEPLQYVDFQPVAGGAEIPRMKHASSERETSPSNGKMGKTLRMFEFTGCVGMART